MSSNEVIVVFFSPTLNRFLCKGIFQEIFNSKVSFYSCHLSDTVSGMLNRTSYRFFLFSFHHHQSINLANYWQRPNSKHLKVIALVFNPNKSIK